MAKNFVSCPNFTSLTPPNPSKNLNLSFPLFNSHHHNTKTEFSSLPKAAFASGASYPPPLNVDNLEREFRGHGVSFVEIGERCAVQMGLDDGSTATVMLPSGVVTSYKPHMWHGGMMEVLHTLVSEGEGGGPIVQGGVSMDFKCGTHHGGIPWSPTTWVLCDVRGTSQNSIQVELMCTSAEAMVEFKHTITLQQDLLSSEINVTNLNSSKLHLMGCVASHLTVSTPDATFAVGLQGSNYYSKPPLRSDFSIIPPAETGQKATSNSSEVWGLTALQGLISSWGGRDSDSGNGWKQGNEEESEGEEDDNYAQLTEKMSRIYTNAPRRFTVIDRGRRNSVIVGTEGFEELYVYSPGSNYKWYGKYAYILTGPSAMLKPLILGPQGVWRGAQYLLNPNN